jgi:hypothetical protein
MEVNDAVAGLFHGTENIFASRIADDKLHPQTQWRHCCLPAIVPALLFQS